jgi:hypothetical protein
MPRDGQQPRKPGNGQVRRGTHGERPTTLEPEQSAALREKLLTALGNITSADSAAIWAHETLAAKNRLGPTDAKLVEHAFERRPSELPASKAVTLPNDASAVAPIARPQETITSKGTDPGQANGIDKSILTLAAPRRYRNREHLRYVAQQACLLCGRKPSDPHHLSFTQPRWSAMSSRSLFLSVGGITARCIAHATSAPGGNRPASTQSRLPAGCGKRRAEWEKDGLNRRCGNDNVGT